MVKETEKQYGAVTSVFWDIGKCPVPTGFDPHLVAPCIKRFLKKLGYFGPLTISAIGLLTDIHDEVLRAVSSTGIVLHATPYGSDCVQSFVFSWTRDNPPPANIMLISDPTVSNSYDLSFLKYHCGYNVINPYRYGPYSTKSLWKKFLMAGALEVEVEDKCIETDESASWFCHGCLIDFNCNTSVCTTGQGVETFTTHLSSQEHAQLTSTLFPPRTRCYDDDEDEEWDDDEEEDEEWDDEHPDIFETAYPQPKTWDWNPGQHLNTSATPSESDFTWMDPLKSGEHPGEFASPSERPRDCATTSMVMDQPEHPDIFATDYTQPKDPHVVATTPRRRRRRRRGRRVHGPWCFSSSSQRHL